MAISHDFGGAGVVVTGGGQGIGFAVARAFLEAGARVAIWDFAAEALAHASAELQSFGDRVTTIGVDVANEDSCAAAAKATPFPIEVLVNNAGITRDRTFAKLAANDFRAVIDVNLVGAANVTRALLESFAPTSNHKRIVNIASIVGLYGNFGQTNYAAAKAGLIGFTKSLARELGRKGFTVNAVAPGFIRTRMTAAMPEEALETTLARVPLGRLGEPEDIASAILYLASREASYVTGTVLSVDGGLVQ